MYINIDIVLEKIQIIIIFEGLLFYTSGRLFLGCVVLCCVVVSDVLSYCVVLYCFVKN